MIISERNSKGVVCYWDDELNASDKKSPLEDNEAVNFYSHAINRWPWLKGRLFHVANESKSQPQYRSKLSQMGLASGVADYIVVNNPPVAIELKRSRKRDSSYSNGQISWLLDAEDSGWQVCIAYGWQAAMQALDDGLSSCISDQ